MLAPHLKSGCASPLQEASVTLFGIRCILHERLHAMLHCQQALKLSAAHR